MINFISFLSNNIFLVALIVMAVFVGIFIYSKKINLKMGSLIFLVLGLIFTLFNKKQNLSNDEIDNQINQIDEDIDNYDNDIATIVDNQNQLSQASIQNEQDLKDGLQKADEMPIKEDNSNAEDFLHNIADDYISKHNTE